MDAPETNNRAKWMRYIVAILLLILLVVVAYGISGKRMPVLISQERASLSDQIRVGEASIPPYTAATAAKLAASKGFQALSSYTEQGFEPREISIKAGETVRFTNNSSDQLWVASQGGDVAVYPRTKSVCGSSDLDSCDTFMPQDFWEFTFEVKGDWQVVNNIDKSKGAVVHVR